MTLRTWIAERIPWIGALTRCDFVGDVRGGDSFSDIYGLPRFLVGFLLSWSVILVKGSIVHFPQTYGPYKSPVARGLARYLLKRSSTIVARDKQSQKIAQELVGPEQTVLLSPDVAFALPVIVPKTIQLEPSVPETGSSREVIGININGLMYHGGYTRKNMFGLKLDYPVFVRDLLIKLLQESAADIWLVPHTYAPPGNVESDNEVCELVRNGLPPELQSRVRMVTGEYDQYEIKGVIGKCGFFIGSRMHACIAALSQGIPCVGVAYSMKFAGVFESVGMQDWIVDARHTGNTEAIERVLELYRSRDSVRAPLKASVDTARARLQEVFKQIVTRSTGSAQPEPLAKTNLAAAQ